MLVVAGSNNQHEVGGGRRESIHGDGAAHDNNGNNNEDKDHDDNDNDEDSDNKDNSCVVL